MIDPHIKLGNGTLIGFSFLTVKIKPGYRIPGIRLQIWEKIPTNPFIKKYKLIMEERVQLTENYVQNVTVGHKFTTSIPVF